MRNQALFEKLAAAEEKFFDTEFFSPVLKGAPVRVRIEGIDVTLKVRPKKFEGWGIFKAVDQTTARFVREPTLKEKRNYLELFPRFSVVVCQRGKTTLGLPANQADSRFSIKGVLPILLPEEVQLFDTIDVRYDGANFWYDRRSAWRTARIARALRDLLVEETEPKDVQIAGLTQEERVTYDMAYMIDVESKKDREEERIKDALQRGGAKYKSYIERGDTYTVEYSVQDANGREHQHRSVVNRDTLQVVTAGICLTDHATGRAHDTDHDLQSLVGVVIEGHNRYLVHRW